MRGCRRHALPSGTSSCGGLIAGQLIWDSTCISAGEDYSHENLAEIISWKAKDHSGGRIFSLASQCTIVMLEKVAVSYPSYIHTRSTEALMRNERTLLHLLIPSQPQQRRNSQKPLSYQSRVTNKPKSNLHESASLRALYQMLTSWPHHLVSISPMSCFKPAPILR